MKNKLIICLLFCLVSGVQAIGQDTYKVINVGFFNLENLFDTLDTPGKTDEEFLPSGLKLYNSAVYMDKLNRLEEVISRIGKDISLDGVAILGVSEIENRKVLEDLFSRPRLAPFNYHIVHYESPDQRGVDVGLVYQPKYFALLDSRSIELPIIDDKGIKRPTRDILYVAGVMDGDTVHIMVNHWPSRRGGEASTEHLRMRGANICREVKDSVLAIHPHHRVIVMGDLNDDPEDPSLTRGLKAKSDARKTGPGDMFNPMHSFFVKGYGTTAYQDAWSLFDQVILSPEWISQNTDGYRFYKANVFNERFMTEKTGKYKGYPLRTYSGDTYNFGYSDHFPVYISFIRKNTQVPK